ncbi:MAG: hypothetical protein SWK76_11905 [Actinomycetota bacterium]|nr:hypothetical protein [Actinomycetota bacterium]
MGEGENGHPRLEFRGARVTADAGLLALRELYETLGLTEMAGVMIEDGRSGRNVRHESAGLPRQSVYARLARLRGRERPRTSPPGPRHAGGDRREGAGA